MKRILSAILALMMVLGLSITTFASVDQLETVDKKAIIEGANEALENMKSVEKDYGKGKVIGKKIVEIYDFAENLIGYHVDVTFGKNNGYLIIATDNKTVIQIGEESFVEKEEKQFKKRNLKKEDIKVKYLFAGLDEHIAKYEKNGEKVYFNIHKKEIKDFNKYKDAIMSSAKKDTESTEIDAEDTMIETYSTTDGEVTHFVQNINQSSMSGNMSDTGCGPAVGATILWYMADNLPKYKPVKSGFSNGVKMAETLWSTPYMNSGVTGTLPSSFRTGIQNLGKDKNVSPITFNSSSSMNYNTLWTSIKTGINSYNVPVALFVGAELNGGSTPEPTIADYHWVTIYGWETWNSNDYIRYKTWGSTYRDNFYYVYMWRGGIQTVYINETVKK